MRTWEQFEREQELAEEPTPELTCPQHGEKFPPRGFCGTCFVEERAQVDDLLRKAGAARNRPGPNG